MKTKIHLLLAVFMLVVVSGAVAQKRNDRVKEKAMSVEKKISKETDRMKRELSLTDKQTTEIREINQKYAQKRKDELNKLTAQDKDLSLSRNLTEDEHQRLKEDLKKQQEAKDAEVKAILSESQHQKYVDKADRVEKKTKDRKDKMKRGAKLADYE